MGFEPREGISILLLNLFFVFLYIMPWERPLTLIWVSGAAEAPSDSCELLKKIRIGRAHV